MVSQEQQPQVSEWTPLRHSLFRAIWFATLAANIGTWMQNVGGVWLMTTLSPSPLLTALMQTATSLPVFLVGIPAGALADIMNRRQVLLITQGWILVAAAGLSIVTFLGLVTPLLLLLFTFAIGLGNMTANPAWQAVNSELVPPEELPAAVTLSSVSFNLARAVGPALGGVIVALVGPGAVFLLNALAFLYVVFVLYGWRPSPHKNLLPTERLIGAIRTGVRYTYYSPELHIVLVRTGAFVFFASALWALMPVVVRQQLRLGSFGYGLLLGCIGIGAVVGAALLPKIQQRLSIDRQVTIGTTMFALVMLALGFVTNLIVLCAVMFAGGIAWLALMSCFNVAAQEAAPSWVRARALGIYLLVFQGSTAIGSTLFGILAGRFGNPIALLSAAIGCMLGLLTALRYHLAQSEQTDFTPWRSTEPQVILEKKLEEGPVLVEIEYHVDPKQSLAFIHAMYDLRSVRERDGAVRWSLYQDPADTHRHIETFMMESWTDYLRQLERMTKADHIINDRALSYQEGSTPPTTRTLIAERLPRKGFISLLRAGKTPRTVGGQT